MSGERRADWALAASVTLATAGVLFWLAPGRIDMIDGQLRYEVAKNLLLHGSADLRDPALPGVAAAGILRSSYALGPSLVGLPGVWLGLRSGSELLAQFLFSLTTPAFGALLSGLMVIGYRLLGSSRAASVAWSLAALFATQLLPTSLSVFDQVQEAVLLLAAVLLLHTSRGALGYALAGLFAGLVVVFQTAYVVLLPALALAVVPWRDWRSKRAWAAPLGFALGMLVGPLLAAAYNHYRFGDAAQIAASGAPARLANPLVGAAVLLLSPGKSVFLYSPLVIVALFGLRQLESHAPRLFRFSLAAIGSQLLLVSSLLFCAGDWCWGPRYLSVTLPLLMLAAPFGARRFSRSALQLLVVSSLMVQLLAISLDHHRFFFDRNLKPEFWADRSFYFKDSALVARPFELLDSARRSFDAPKMLFPGPHPELPTYATYGPPPGWVSKSRLWQGAFPGLYWLRPWPAWTRNFGTFVDHPVLAAFEAALGFCVLLGGLLTALSIRRQGSRSASDEPARDESASSE